MTSFKHYNEMSDIVDAIEYLRGVITKPPYNFSWQIHDSSSYSIAQTIMQQHMREPDMEITLALTEVPHDANGDPIYGGHYLQFSTRTSRIGAFRSHRTTIAPQRNVGLEFEYPCFVDGDFGYQVATMTDFRSLVDQKYKQPQDILGWAYSQPRKNVDFTVAALKEVLEDRVMLINMEVYNKMKINTVQSTLEALDILQVPPAQIIVFKIKNNLPVDPKEVNDDILGSLI